MYVLRHISVNKEYKFHIIDNNHTVGNGTSIYGT